MSDRLQRVRIYLTAEDQSDGRPLHIVVLERLQHEGSAGAIVLSGVAGFGHGYRADVATRAGLSDFTPVVIEWLDRPDRIEQILPLIDELLPHALITTESVEPYRAALGGTGLFAGANSVGDIMDTPPPMLTPEFRMGKVIATMLTSGQTTLPVVDERGHLVGVIDEQQMTQRVGIALSLGVLRLLNEQEGRDLLKPFLSVDLTTVMNNEPRSVYVNATIPQALVSMVEWGYRTLPVLNREGVLVGLLSQDHILRTYAAQSGTNDAMPTPVHLIMQTAVPNISITATLATAIQYLLNTPGTSLVVIDSERRVQGTLNDVSVISRLQGHERAFVLSKLQQRDPQINLAEIPGAERGFADMVDQNVVTILPNDTIAHAAQQLVERKLEHVPVADEEGRLVGLVARGGLMRALMQSM